MKLKRFLGLKPETALFVGGLILILTSQPLVDALSAQFHWKVYLFLALGFIFFITGALSLYTNKFPNSILRVLEKAGAKLSVYPSQVIHLFVSLCLAITATLAAGESAIMWNMPLSATAWVLSIVLSVLGCWHKDEALPKVSRRTLLVAGLFFLIGFTLRAIGAETIPPVLNGDEASAGLSAVRFIDGQVDNIFSIGWFSFPSFFYYLQSVFIRVLGQTTTALRIPSAIIGGLTISVVYLIGRRMFNPQTGLLAAIFMTGFHFHMHFSRIGLNNIWDSFWFILVLGMLWDGVVHKRRSSFLIAGVGLGLAQYFYVTVRFLPFTVLLWLGVLAIFDRKKLQGNGGSFFSLLLLPAITFIPMAWFYIRRPYEFLAPYSRVSVIGGWLKDEIVITGLPAWCIILKQLSLSLQSFVNEPLQMWYSPGTGILRWPTAAAAFFLIGIILLAIKWRDSRTHLFAIWLAVFIATGTMSLPATAAQRYVAAAPVCALLVGYALSEIPGLISKDWPEIRRGLNVLAVIAAAVISLTDLQFYFFEYTPRSYMGGPNTLVAQRLAEYLQTKEDLEVAFFGDPRMGYYSISSLPYLAPHIQGYDFHHPWGSKENPTLTNEHIIFVLLPEQQGSLTAIMEDYPGGVLKKEYDPYNSILYWYYEVSE
ncbi:MAG: glycosyltransferase family 39 protein [Anaerolineales bacterium]